MTLWPTLALASLGLGLVAAAEANASVVIAEVSWGDPRYVELHNPSEKPVDLHGYRLLGDVRHQFMSQTLLPPGGRLILAGPSGLRRSGWSACPVVESWGGRPGKKGHLELYDESATRVDRVHYRQDTKSALHRRSAAAGYRGQANWFEGAPTPGSPAPPAPPLPGLLLDSVSITPSQPRPGQAVTLSVRAQGASEKTRVVAHWRSRHGASSATLAPQGTGSVLTFTGEVPGLPDQTLVQLSFEAEDPTAGEAKLVVDGSRSALQYFVLGEIPTKLRFYCLELEPERVPVLLKDPERDRFKGHFIAVRDGRAEIHNGVTLQIRGGTWTRRWLKRGMVISFSARSPFEGYRQINLRGQWHDESNIREQLGYDLFNELGVAAPRSRPARVHLNGELLGVYSEVEMIDAIFLARNGMAGGVLYQALVPKRQSGPDRCDGQAYSTVAGYEAHWSKRTHLDEPYDDLARFVDGMHMTRDEDLEAYFAEHLQIDSYIGYLVGVCFITHWDSLVKNYYWCFDREGSGRWVVIPWDLDRTWGDDFRSAGYSSASPLEGTEGQKLPPARNWFHWLRTRFLSVPAYRVRYLKRLLKALGSEAHPRRLGTEIDGQIERIRADLIDDRALWGSYAHGTPEDAEFVPGEFKPSDLDNAQNALKFYAQSRARYLSKTARRLLSRDRQLYPELSPLQVSQADPASPTPDAASARADDTAAESQTWALGLPVVAFFYLLVSWREERA